MDDLLAYDEDKAVDFIRASMPADLRDKYSSDDILFIIDTIWDYYDKKGFLELSADIDSDDTVDVADLTAFVTKEIKKDGEICVDSADIVYIVKGELAYEESLETFGN